MPDSLTYLLGLEQIGIKFGLENIRTLVDRLDHPERAFRSIHVAGTNGKGSVTAMLDTALRAAGHRSGRYTSPHLVDLTERFVIDGRRVETAALNAAVAEVRHAIDDLRATGALQVQPTFFEVTTAVAFELFRRAGVDTAVVEVGLGGRLDATNVITPVASAITSIAFDHQKYLGSTLRDIAREKAGIIKPGVPVVVGDLAPEALAAIEDTAREQGAELIRASEGVTIDAVRVKPHTTDKGSVGVRLQPDISTIRLRTPTRNYGEIDLALAGAHQIANALVAVRVLEVADTHSVTVPRDAVVKGLASVSWPGRIDRRTLPDGRELILDAAHNPAGAAALAAYLAGAGGPKLPLVFAAMRDKDVGGMFLALLPAVGAVFMTQASNLRTTDPEVLAHHARIAAPNVPVQIEPSLDEALDAAWQISRRIVVAGSIFLVGDVLKRIGE
ncbi:MAG: bifunctional folylpolyglutamate synthase/dihydrofolate synthase [Acidobacteria bacterium]|nr:MAG: bifunctional folylpolyglutamate synthase/dihydrofolate synthase [Acidobacteriota bacterium]